MSNKLPLYAVDKCRVMIIMPAEVKVKLEELSKETGVSVSALACGAASDLVKDREFTAENLVRLNEIITENMRKRDQLKLRKGGVLMNDNLISMEIAIDASLFVGLEAAAKEKGGQTVSQLLSSFLQNWVSAYPAKRTRGKRRGTDNRRVA